MDDFQHRLLVALERLAGRGEGAGLGDRLEAYENQLNALIIVLEEIRDRLADLVAPVEPGP